MVGPHPQDPDWTMLLRNVQRMLAARSVHQHEINGLAQAWERLAHEEAVPRFQRKHEAGGRLHIAKQWLRQALLTTEPLKATPSVAAISLVNHLR